MPEIASRRERPAKPALTRDEIIATAVRLFRAQGLGKVTMRSVARELDTGHASLYVYVRDTADLHAQILDAELGAVELPTGNGPWRPDLVKLLLRYGRILSSNAELARTVFFARLDGPNYTALVETVLGLLERAGITGRTAAWGLDVLLQFPAAAAAEHADSPGDPDAAVPDPRALGIDPKLYPRIAAAADELFSGTPASRSSWVVNLLIDGLLAASTSPSEDSASERD